MDFLIQEGAQVLATVGAPFVLGLLIVGTTVGILQAATQINDPALGAVPRLAVAVGLAVTLGGWIAETLAGFLARSLEHLANGP
jgi:flagellar biosynthesis protein FliQ